MESATQVFRPAPLPDNRRLVWYPLAICGALAGVGLWLSNAPLIVVPLIGAAVFPGFPIAIHTLYFLSIKITLNGDQLAVVDWAGDPFVSYPRKQEIELSRVAYVYHLGREADANKRKEPSAPYCNTKISLRKYQAADANPRRTGAIARTNNGLVLSDKGGQDKVYLMHFHDLSQKDWQQLARLVQKSNKGISFLMDDNETVGFLGQTV